MAFDLDALVRETAGNDSQTTQVTVASGEASSAKSKSGF